MFPGYVLSAAAWARREFAGTVLGDARRTRRAVQMAARIMENPSGSLPAQMRSPDQLKAAYRLLDEEDVTFPQLVRPHCRQTLAACQQEQVVLMVQDTTQLVYTPHKAVKGLGHQHD